MADDKHALHKRDAVWQSMFWCASHFSGGGGGCYTVLWPGNCFAIPQFLQRWKGKKIKMMLLEHVRLNVSLSARHPIRIMFRNTWLVCVRVRVRQFIPVICWALMRIIRDF